MGRHSTGRYPCVLSIFSVIKIVQKRIWASQANPRHNPINIHPSDLTQTQPILLTYKHTPQNLDLFYIRAAPLHYVIIISMFTVKTFWRVYKSQQYT